MGRRARLVGALLLLAVLAGSARSIRFPFGPTRPCPAKAGSVLRDEANGGWRFIPAEGAGAASGSYVDGSHTASNFGQLHIQTSGEFSDEDQMFAAGYLEGYLTAARIWDNYVNMQDYFTRTMEAEVEGPMNWIQQQDAWVRGRCQEEGPAAARASGEEARYWQSVCLLLTQFDGLKAGYRAARAEAAAGDASQADGQRDGGIGEMSDYQFLFVHSNADLYDLIDAQQPDQRPSWIQSSAEPAIPTVHGSGGRHWEALEAAAREDPKAAAAKLFSKVALGGKCSALVKVAPDLSDLFMGHSTWDSFTAMLRIFKHYTFDLRQLAPATRTLSFSSYPGELFSDDDFFILGTEAGGSSQEPAPPSGLVVMQTTNKIFNDELFDRLDPRTVLSWQRVRAAGWLARDGEEWARTFALHNSGTYNNQYMVVDLSKFTPGQELRPGLLWAVEQIPGKVVSADVTDTLSFGYWPSFNVPYFPEIYNASGYPDFVSRLEKYGQHFGPTTHWLSYQESPRAKIFRRDQGGVADLEGMKALMRQNRWRTDPLSEGHPICAVCGRGDLDSANPVARGCYDTKVTSWSLATRQRAEAVNGPTADGWPWSVPAFRWSEAPVANLTHRGMPERYSFTFEVMDPLSPVPATCARSRGLGGESGVLALNLAL